MDDIITKIYNHDKNLFMEKIYEPWIQKLKIKSEIKINQLKTCIWCHQKFDTPVYGLCSDCNSHYNII